jgi:hypothetical protein
MRIAVLMHDDSPNAYYRALMPMEAVAQRGHQVAFGYVRGPAEVPSPGALAGFDVVYFWRLFYEPIWRLARALAAHGVGVVWDNDDDIAALPKNIPAYKTYAGPNARRTRLNMRAMMRAAHVVTAPSRHLADVLGELRDAPVTVMENYLPAVHKVSRKARGDTVVVGWTASGEHRQDWEGLRLAAVLQRLLDEHPELVVKSIGVRMGFEGPRYEHVNRVLVQDLPSYVAHFDVGIAPLLDIPFNRARSNIKLKEYTAVGAAWVASDVGPYRGMGEREGGLAIRNDDWHAALTALIVDAKRRRQLAANGEKWARTQVIGAHAGRWEQVLSEAAERARTRATTPTR